jgi:hypothetical protein
MPPSVIGVILTLLLQDQKKIEAVTSLTRDRYDGCIRSLYQIGCHHIIQVHRKVLLLKCWKKAIMVLNLQPRSFKQLHFGIDLAVPYAGDYKEAHAWSEKEMATYNHFLEKRLNMEAIEKQNMEALLRKRFQSLGN